MLIIRLAESFTGPERSLFDIRPRGHRSGPSGASHSDRSGNHGGGLPLHSLLVRFPVGALLIHRGHRWDRVLGGESNGFRPCEGQHSRDTDGTLTGLETSGDGPRGLFRS